MPFFRLEPRPASPGRCRNHLLFLFTFCVLLVAKTISLPAVTFTNGFANPSSVTIPSVGAASPYPSSITVSGVTGSVSKVTVTLNQLSHSYPDDIDMLLIGPAGQSVLIMSDTGGGNLITNVNLTFDDAASASLPDAT